MKKAGNRTGIMENEILSQEQIRFNNIASKHYSGWWGDSPYKSYGSIMHWIYVYSGLEVAERISIGKDCITYCGKLYATFMFNDELQIPIFEFQEENEWSILNQDAYLKGLAEKWTHPYFK